MRLCHRHRWVRLVLSLFAATVVCVVSRSALAAAPQCDVRAATTLAPNPTLDGPTGAVDAAANDCSPAAQPIDHAIQQDRAPSASDAGEPLPRAAMPTGLRILPAAPADALANFDETFTLPAGVRARVDRPPRG